MSSESTRQWLKANKGGLILGIGLIALGAGLIVWQTLSLSDHFGGVPSTRSLTRHATMRDRPRPPAPMTDQDTFASVSPGMHRMRPTQPRLEPPREVKTVRPPARRFNLTEFSRPMAHLYLPPPSDIRLAWSRPRQRLWISYRSYNTARRSALQSRFVMYEPATESWREAPRIVGSEVNDLAVNQTGVWLATRKGVRRIDPDTLNADSYDAKTGLKETDVGAVAAVADVLIVAGNSHTWSRFNAGTNAFVGFDAPDSAAQPGTPEPKTSPAPLSRRQRIEQMRRRIRERRNQLDHVFRPDPYRYRRFTPFHDWLLYQSDQLRALNLKNHQSQSLDALLKQTIGPPPRDQAWKINGFAVGRDAIWLTTDAQLVRLDLAQKSARQWPMPAHGPFTLGCDGDFVWAAYSGPYDALDVHRQPARRAESYVLLWHTPSAQWVGSFRIEGKVQTFCSTPGKMWIGLEQTDEPLVSIDKAAFYASLGRPASPLASPPNPDLKHTAAATDATPAIRAAYAGNLDFLRHCAKRDLAPTPTGWTPLLAAVAGGRPDVVDWLLSQKADPNQQNTGSRIVSPLYLACANGDLDCARSLLAAGATVDVSVEGGRTPLLAAADSGNLSLVKLLLEKGADPLSVHHVHFNNTMGIVADSPLVRAVKNHDLPMAQAIAAKRPAGPWEDGPAAMGMAIRRNQPAMLHWLLESTACPQGRGLDGSGRAPFDWAVAGGNPRMIDDLLNHQADPDYGGDPRQSPLDVACRAGDLDLVKRLVAAGADVNRLSDQSFNGSHGSHTVLVTPFIVATQYGQGRIMQFLLEHGCDLHKPIDGIPQGDLALIMAARRGRLPFVRLLARDGFDLNARDHDRCTPVWWAAGESQFSTLQWLLDQGADARAAGANHKTPLEVASNKRIRDLLQKHLAAHPATSPSSLTAAALSGPNATDADGWPPLVLAAATGHKERVADLLAAGATVNAAGPGGWTALMQACKHGNADIAEQLLRGGADPLLQNHWGRIAADIAAEYHQSAALNVLTRHGAVARDGRALIDAVRRSDLNRVAELLHQGMNVNGEDQTGRTALFYALDGRDPPNTHPYRFHRDPWIVKLLVRSGADVNHQDRQGQTPLNAALELGADVQPSPDLIRLLVAHGAKVSNHGDARLGLIQMLNRIKNPADRRTIEQLLRP